MTAKEERADKEIQQIVEIERQGMVPVVQVVQKGVPVPLNHVTQVVVEEPQDIKSGYLGRWNSEKGFGFIKPIDGGEALFCHWSALLGGEGSVKSGDKVNFKITFDDRKRKHRAKHIAMKF